MPKCSICGVHLPTPSKMAAWLETQVKRVEDETQIKGGGVDYPSRSGGYRATLNILLHELRGTCYHHAYEKKESS